MLRDASFDPAQTVILDNDGPSIDDEEGNNNAEGVVRTLRYDRDGVTIEVDNGAPGYVVLADNWVPYWVAAIDGEPVEIRRAFCTFMAVHCPQGDHTIRFTYRSGPYETGKMITLTAVAFVIASLVAAGVSSISRRKRMKPS
jgi:uncharacterized membrane protein YfhO